tara:strand:+ start:270 stop:713 length:444 start_codon:yes stop_codon:yes gene_type:complete
MRPATRDQAKQRAAAIRAELAAAGTAISHAQALERVAGELGYRDWNTAAARLSNRPPEPLQIGDRVAGLYLKQPFKGRVLAVRELSGGSAFAVTVQFDEPVDVVTFDSFSSFRQRVNATITLEGRSLSKTSDGEPHMVVARSGDATY